MTKIYLSGPMTGYPDYNKQAFAEATAQLRDLGFQVVNPHELKEPFLKMNDPDYNWRQYLARDISVLLTEGIEGVVVLPGWEKSRGSLLELHVAQFIGLKVFPLDAVIHASKLVEQKGGVK